MTDTSSLPENEQTEAAKKETKAAKKKAEAAKKKIEAAKKKIEAAEKKAEVAKKKIEAAEKKAEAAEKKAEAAEKKAEAAEKKAEAAKKKAEAAKKKTKATEKETEAAEKKVETPKEQVEAPKEEKIETPKEAVEAPKEKTNTFKDIGLDKKIVDAILKLGFETPTPIQAKTIPHLLSSNQDLIAFAQTGTGKTAAFGLPAIHLTDTDSRNTQTLILCPTRELCLQITRDLTNYAKNMRGVNVVAIYGGASADTQIKALRGGAQIVVGTPGRTKDLMNRRKLLLGNVERVVLDEADEMLSMGFQDDLDEILSETHHEKQTLLFSATMSKEIMSITKKYMNNPVEIAAAQKNTAADNVQHKYYMVQARDRYEVLKRIADINPNIYGIVFCRTRRETKEIANKLMTDGYNADALHGDLSQAQRDEVMSRFRSHHLQILVATDVAARGLDVKDLTHIISFNLPDDIEIYIHRSGRTGRAGKSGTAIAIVHTRESRRIKDLEYKFKIKFTKEPVPSGKDICKKQLFSLIDKIEKVKVDDKQIEPFLPTIYEKLEWLSREDLIKHFVSAEFNRFLSYYKNARDLNVSDRNQRNEREPRSRDRDRDRDRDGNRERKRDFSFTRLYINAGSRNGLTPARLIGVINECLDSSDAEIGKIEILKSFSFFEMDKNIAPLIIKGLTGVVFEEVTLKIEVSQEKPGGSSTPSNRIRPRGFGGSNDRRSSGGGDRRRSGGGDRRRSGGSDRRSGGGDRRSGGGDRRSSGGDDRR